MNIFGWSITLGIIIILGCSYFLYRWYFKRFYYQTADCPFSSTVILLVKNQEKHIEGVMRNILRLQKDLSSNIQLVVVDLGSEDQTLPILHRLCYPNQYFILVEALSNQGINDWMKYCKGKKVHVLEMMGRINGTHIIRQVKNIIWNDVAGTSQVGDKVRG